MASPAAPKSGGEASASERPVREGVFGIDDDEDREANSRG